MFGFRKRQDPGEAPSREAAGREAGAPAADVRRLRLRFVGQVQGVGFRWTALGVARDLELTGWVRNEPDGSVSAEIQGTPSHVGAFFSHMLEAFRRYPVSFTLDEREDIPTDPGEKDFEVRYR